MFQTCFYQVSQPQSGPKSEGEESDFYSDEEGIPRKSAVGEREQDKQESKVEHRAGSNDWTGVSSESEAEEKPKVKEDIHEEEEDYGMDVKEDDNDGQPSSSCKFWA